MGGRKTWTPRIDKLDPMRVRELKFFCRQYGMKKREMNNARNALRIMEKRGEYDEKLKEKAERVIYGKEARDLEIMESAIRETAGKCEAVRRGIMANVCDGLPWERIDVPMGRGLFYAAVRSFYRRLDEKQRSIYEDKRA